MHYPGDVDAGSAPGGQERPTGGSGLPWPGPGDDDQPVEAGDTGERYPGSGYADSGNPDARITGSGYAAQDGDAQDPDAGPARGVAAARALYGAAGGTAGKGPVRGFPPAPGQSAPVYPPGQFSAWNQASGRTREEPPGNRAVKDARPAAASAGGTGKDAWPAAASAEHGYAAPHYSVLAVSDPAADATSTQTWAVIDDRTAGGWRNLNARDNPPQGGAARSPASRRTRGHPARQPAATAQAGPVAPPPPGPDEASGRRGTRQAGADAAGTPNHGQRPQGRAASQAGDLPGRAARGSSRGKRGRKPPKRGRVLLAAGLAVIVAAGSGTYFYLTSGRQQPGPAAAAPGTTNAARPSPRPSPTPTGRWGHIQTRLADPQPLTLAELFPARFTSTGSAYSRTAARARKHCSSAVLGSRLQSAVGAAGCSQVMRASYLSGNRKLMGTIGVLNLKTARKASRAGQAAGPSEFIAQLRGSKGPTRNLTKGTGIEEAEVKGHYLILIWAEFADLHAPKGAAKKKELVQFCTRLLANTANVSLSRRLVTGKP
jgi:hypothetical protein